MSGFIDALVWIGVNGFIVFVIVKAVQNFRKGRKEKSSEG